MKTQITKENAVLILDNILRLGRLSHKLDILMDTVSNEWLVAFSDVCAALFNVDPLQQNELEEYHQTYYKIIGSETIDYRKDAERLYTRCLELSLRHEEQIEKTTEPKTMGVISLLKGHNYNIQGNFNLET